MTAAEIPRAAQLVATLGCPTCDGTGRVASPAWQAMRRWARRQGHEGDDTTIPSNLTDTYFRRQGHEDWPDPTEVCESCDGVGHTVHAITVEDLVMAVVAEFDRPVVTTSTVRGWITSIERAITAAASASEGLLAGDVDDHLRTVQEGAHALVSIEPLTRPTPTLDPE